MQISYEKELPGFMKKMEHLLEANDDGSGYFIGNEVLYIMLNTNISQCTKAYSYSLHSFSFQCYCV